MRGFTLLEIMVILGISAILGGAGTLSVYNFRVEKSLVLHSQELLANLRDAQQKLLNLNRRNLELFEEVQKLAKKDPELMEGLARRRGMVRPGETVYTFRDRNGR